MILLPVVYILFLVRITTAIQTLRLINLFLLPRRMIIIKADLHITAQAQLLYC